MKPTRCLILIFLIGAVVLTSAAVVRAQFTFTTNNGAITITGYTGSGGTVVIPETINGYPVTTIGEAAFEYDFAISNVVILDGITSISAMAFWVCTNLCGITIPDSVTNIGDYAFSNCGFTRFIIPANVTIGSGMLSYCPSLTNVVIANGVTSISDGMFGGCGEVGTITIPNSLRNIGDGAFAYCNSVTNIIIPSSVTNMGDGVFEYCTNLTGAYFCGNAPGFLLLVFDTAPNSTVYYLPGTTGWGTNYAGAPTAPWYLPNPLILNNEPGFGMQSNGFGFTVSWATNASVMVDASSNLSSPNWQPIQTNALTVGTFYFTDPQWTSHPSRFYRLRSP
jgi:hypothetical protein